MASKYRRTYYIFQNYDHGLSFENIILNINHYLSKKSLNEIAGIAIFFTIIVGLIDEMVGPEISTTILYFIPVSIAAWYGGRFLGVVIACAAATTWLITDFVFAQEYLHSAIYLLNTFMRLGIFIFITIILTNLYKRLKAEEIAADTDVLTGALNARGFNERLAEEYARSTRNNKTFSLAFIDIDNFKEVNDTLGHSMGDFLLKEVSTTADDNLRKTDHFARLGGDEFAILFSETDANIVKAAYSHVHDHLLELVQLNQWPISFSVGVVSFDVLPDNPTQAIKIADEIMYSVKKSTKNNVVYKTWRGPSLA